MTLQRLQQSCTRPTGRMLSPIFCLHLQRKTSSQPASGQLLHLRLSCLPTSRLSYTCCSSASDYGAWPESSDYNKRQGPADGEAEDRSGGEASTSYAGRTKEVCRALLQLT